VHRRGDRFVELARSGGDADLRRLTEQAQKSFGVELAVVSLVEGDRLYHGTNTDVVPTSVPLELSFCRYTVESGEPVIIPDTGKDPRFDGNPLVDVSFINFYAGYPLRATDGHVIGSFCLQGSQPRKQSAVALDLLRQLALEAEEVLRGYETATPARGAVQVVMPTPSGAPIHF
jgi:GAF domain-containing protein